VDVPQPGTDLDKTLQADGTHISFPKD
jgi:hypothetical protein